MITVRQPALVATLIVDGGGSLSGSIHDQSSQSFDIFTNASGTVGLFVLAQALRSVNLRCRCWTWQYVIGLRCFGFDP